MVTSYFETKRQLKCGDLLARKQKFGISGLFSYNWAPSSFMEQSSSKFFLLCIFYFHFETLLLFFSLQQGKTLFCLLEMNVKLFFSF
jgi:hypothetical protein